MSSTGAVWLVIGVACIAANLPFLNHRLLGMGPLLQPRKALPLRLGEMVVFYLLSAPWGCCLKSALDKSLPKAGSSMPSRARCSLP